MRPYRFDIIDVRQGVAGAQDVVDIGGSPALLALRLKIEGRKLTETETIVAHNQAEGMIFEVGALQTASKAMTTAPDPAQLNSREEMIAIAVRYPNGLKIGLREERRSVRAGGLPLRERPVNGRPGLHLHRRLRQH